MTSADICKIEKLLMGFLERATKENATPAEVEALPQVALALAELHKLY